MKTLHDYDVRCNVTEKRKAMRAEIIKVSATSRGYAVVAAYDIIKARDASIAVEIISVAETASVTERMISMQTARDSCPT